MRRISFAGTILFFSIYSWTCFREPDEIPIVEVANIKYPELEYSIKSITNEVALGGRFLFKGNVRIKSFGCVWDTFPSPSVDLLSKIVRNAPMSDTFLLSVTGLNYQTKYFLRLYVEIADTTLYFDQIDFQTNAAWVEMKDYPNGPISGAGLAATDSLVWVFAGYPNQNSYASFNPITNDWIVRGIFPINARNAVAAFSIGSSAYIGTGTSSTITPVKSFIAFDMHSNEFSPVTDFGGTAREGAVGFSLNGKGYVGLGTNGTTFFNDFWEYDPLLNNWTKIPVNFSGGGRHHAIAFTVGNKAYIGLGSTNSVQYRDLWEFDPNRPSPWRRLPDLDCAGGPGYMAFSTQEKGFVCGGPTKEFWQFDPSLEKWIRLAPLPFSSSYGNAVTTPKNAFILGGRNENYELTPKFWKLAL